MLTSLVILFVFFAPAGIAMLLARSRVKEIDALFREADRPQDCVGAQDGGRYE